MYYDLDLIRNNISLVDLAEEAGARFDNPNKLSSHCPLPRHTGDRSSRAFMIYENGRRWKCHSSCPANANSGDIVDFYMAWKNVDFKTAVSELSLRTSLVQGNVQAPIVSKIPVAFPAIPRSPADEWYARAEQFIQWAEYNLAQDIGAQQYLIKERGLSPETCKAFRLGYNPSNTYEDAALWGLDGKKIWLPRGIVIPGFLNGKPSYIKIRRPLPGQLLGNYIGDWAFHDGLPDVKFGGPRGGVTCLFRLELPRHEPVLVLTEGEWDAMLLWEHCPYMCDSGTLGGAGAKLDTLDLLQLSAYPVILVVHDNDEAGDV